MKPLSPLGGIRSVQFSLTHKKEKFFSVVESAVTSCGSPSGRSREGQLNHQDSQRVRVTSWLSATRRWAIQSPLGSERGPGRTGGSRTCSKANPGPHRKTLWGLAPWTIRRSADSYPPLHFCPPLAAWDTMRGTGPVFTARLQCKVGAFMLCAVSAVFAPSVSCARAL